MNMARIYLTPSIACPLSEARLAPPGAPVTERVAYDLGDGTVLVLHPDFPGPIAVDSAAEVAVLRKLADALHAALPTRDERAVAGRLTEEDKAEIAAEEEAAREAAHTAEAEAFQAELRAKDSPGARAKREAREAAAAAIVEAEASER
jgi:hypothetical protein